ncbi:MAG: response regulator transcription factor [Bifidobacteriaceae bacterium]|nr:response regulator transcription factor [Bifidobacteriaceae bacterium]
MRRYAYTGSGPVVRPGTGTVPIRRMTQTPGQPRTGSGQLPLAYWRVAIVDQETLFRTLVTDAINNAPDMRVVASLDSVAKAREMLPGRRIDLLIVDVEQRDGSGAVLAAELQRMDPHLRILIMSRHDVRSLIESTRRHLPKPWSYASKLSSMGSADLVARVRAAAVLADGEQQVTAARQDDVFQGLTGQQMAVLRLIADGYTNQQVAERIGLSRRTVENHLLAIYKALGISEEEVNPRVAAVLLFLSHTLKM